MSSPFPDRADFELFELLDALCREQISAEQHARLQAMLREDANARRLYLEYLDLHLGLARIVTLEASRETVKASGPRPEEMPGRLTPLPFSRKAGHADGDSTRPRNPALVRHGLLVLVIAFAVVWVATRTGQQDRQDVPPPRSEPALALIEHVTGRVVLFADDGQRRPALGGGTVAAGETIETREPQSRAVVSFGDGTQILVAGNSRVRWIPDDARRLRIQQGTLAAYVTLQPPGQPMIVETPLASVEVLGTEFFVSAETDQTAVEVAKGRVQVIRTADGKSVVVGEGKRLVTNEASELVVRPAQPLAGTWSAGFEAGLPAGWQSGTWVSEDLPPGSRGGVKAERNESPDGPLYSIIAPEAWLEGLFTVHEDSQLQVTFKMDRPDWLNVFFITRTSDPKNPTVFLHLYNELPFAAVEPGRWHTLTLPLAKFQRKIDGQFTQQGPVAGELVYGLNFSAQAPDRGLVIDRVSVTRGGPMNVRLN